MKVERIPLHLIEMGDRLRAIDPDRVLMIMASAETSGIRQPIEIRPARTKGRYLLVSGGHRLTAALELSHADIPATVLPMLTDDEARLLEIDENIYRAELSELDRAVFLAEKKAIHERLHPQTRHGGDRRSQEARDRAAIFGHLTDRFTEEVRERLDLSERALRRVIARARIAKDVRERIGATPVARNGSELDALVKLDEDQQRRAVALVLSGGPGAPKRIAEAAALIAGKRQSHLRPDDDIQLSALTKAWKNASARARRRFLDELASQEDSHLTAMLTSPAPSRQEAA